MLITNQTNYALRILMYCALYHPQRATVPKIAEAYRISASQLFKLLPVLTGLGVLVASRGRQGGVQLARDPSDISLGSIFRETETRMVRAECFQDCGVKCPFYGQCKLQHIWAELLDSVLKVLDDYSIEDLVANRSQLQQRLGLDNR